MGGYSNAAMPYYKGRDALSRHLSLDQPSIAPPSTFRHHPIMPPLQPIKVWGAAGPNPPKIGYVLEELALPYEVIDLPFADLKLPAYLAVNPNGRVPAIHDPNTGLTLWESGAIVEYLVETYDGERKISFEPGSKEAQWARQWLFFQVSGQGPYVS